MRRRPCRRRPTRCHRSPITARRPELVPLVAIHRDEAGLQRAERNGADRRPDEQGDEVGLSLYGLIDSIRASSSTSSCSHAEPRPSSAARLGRRRARAATRSSGGCSEKSAVVAAIRSPRSAYPASSGTLVRVELDAAGREQRAIDVLRARPRGEIGEPPERRDVDVEPSADDRGERRRAVGPVHHVPRLGERASPPAFERREEHRRRERRHDVGHDLAGVAAGEHGIVRVECRVELVCGHVMALPCLMFPAAAHRRSVTLDPPISISAKPIRLVCQQIVDQRLGHPVVLEVERPRAAGPAACVASTSWQRDEVAAQQLLVAHRPIAVLLLELPDRRLRRLPGLRSRGRDRSRACGRARSGRSAPAARRGDRGRTRSTSSGTEPYRSPVTTLNTAWMPISCENGVAEIG